MSGEPVPSRWLRWRRHVARTFALAAPSVSRALVPAHSPLQTVRHTYPGKVENLWVLLPGIDDLPGDFAAHGFVDRAWRSGLVADAMEPDLHLGYYLRHQAVARLHNDLLRPARGIYHRIWLVGISLGGLGALLYASQYPDDVQGIVLLAPFLGHGPIIQDLSNGGLPIEPAQDSDFQHQLWDWLAGPAPKPPIYLGFGYDDPFAPANRLLAELLPKGRVFLAHGGHDWDTWSRLWPAILSRVLTQPRHWA